MTAFLRRGDRIMLAVPNFDPQATAQQDHAHWQAVYDAFGVEVVHVSVHYELTHPVVVAVLREDVTPVASCCEGHP